MQKSSRKGEDTRERILDAAETAVLEKGFAGTSIDELIAAVGLTKSGFFYHFKDKGELAKALLIRYVDRENELFGELFQRFERHVFAIALRRLGDYAEAQELTQDVFIRALTKLDQLRTPEAFGGWLRSITNRMAINRLVRRPQVRRLEDALRRSANQAGMSSGMSGSGGGMMGMDKMEMGGMPGGGMTDDSMGGMAFGGMMDDDYLQSDVDADLRALWRDRLRHSIIPERHVIVAEDAGDIGGFICVQVDKHPTRGTLIDNLHVDAARHRSGIGRELMRRAALWMQGVRPRHGVPSRSSAP